VYQRQVKAVLIFIAHAYASPKVGLTGTLLLGTTGLSQHRALEITEKSASHMGGAFVAQKSAS